MKKAILLIAILIPCLAVGQLADSSKRLVKLDGALNFRDVGGYKTDSGKEVKWNKVFRSASINKLTDADMDTLKARRIYTVIDLRGKKESAAAPDRLLAGTDYTLSPAGSDELPSGPKMMELMKKGNFLDDFYGEAGIEYFAERYRPIFKKLLNLNDTTALLYHCTGGRDRTGMATALFLYTLGVPQKTIEEDFTASNVYLAPMMEKMFEPMAKSIGMSREEIEKKMNLHPGLIHIFFNSIKKRYGSLENFMEKEMGIGEKEKATLRLKYTS